MDATLIFKCLLMGGGAAVLVFHQRQIREAIEAFTDNFPRGGSGTPMHPSPAADDTFLRHRGSRKVAGGESVL
jgi:hypothetical protein